MSNNKDLLLHTYCIFPEICELGSQTAKVSLRTIKVTGRPIDIIRMISY